MPQPNDAFASPTTLVGNSGSLSGEDTTGTTFEASEINDFNSGDGGSLWYEWTPTFTGWATITITPAGGLNKAISAFTGVSLAGLVLIDTASDGLVFNLTFKVVSGTTYRLQLWVSQDIQDGTFDIAWAPYVPPASGTPYDNIQDALALTQDGLSHSVDLDNTGATMETNESSQGEDESSIWIKFDFSNPDYAIIYGNNIPIDFKVEYVSGGITPFMQLFSVSDVTFDPADPDFSKLSSTAYDIGDGTGTPPELIDVLDAADSVTGIFYWFIGDWNFPTSPGVLRITYTLPAPPAVFTVDASDYNLSSTTITNLGGGVIEETQLIDNDFVTDRRGVIDQIWTFRVENTFLPPNGRYLPILEMQFSGTYTNAEWFCSIRRNGELLLPPAWLTAKSRPGIPSPKNLWNLYGPQLRTGTLSFGTRDYSEGHGPSTIPILAGDIIEFAIYNDNNPTDGSVARISGVKFVQVEAGGSSTSINLATIDRNAVGPNADGRDDPPNEKDVHQKEIAVLNNGDVYVFYTSRKSTSPFGESLKLIKLSGGVWSTVSSDVSHAALGANYVRTGSQPVPYGQISIDTDGTDLWLAWGEADYTFSKLLTFPNGTTTGTFYAYKWHVKKYVPGTGFTELGTGQNAIPLSARTKAASSHGNAAPDCATYETSIQLKVAPNGVPWVITAETQDAFYGTFVPHSATFEKPYVYYWDGATWVDTMLPDPPNVDLTNDQGGYVDFITVDAQHQLDLTFCHHNGPSNYPSIIYSYGSFDSGRGVINQRFIYQEYGGSAWGNLINQTSFEIWPGETLSEQRTPAWTGGHGQQGMSLKDDGTVPIFGVALWNANIGSDFIKVAKVKPDGSALEPYQAGTRIGADILFIDFPGQSDGGWFDPTGCDMAIGPDKKPWIIFTGTDWDEYGLIVSRFGEAGTENYFIIGSRQNGLLLGEETEGFSKIKIVGNQLYILGYFETGFSSQFMGIYSAPINDPYNAWAAGGIASILAYYKDGAWHQANSEASRDLYYYKNGTWHKKDNGLQAHKNAMWQA